MLAAGSLASSLFSEETFHKFKHNSIKEAWNLLISDQELKKKFEVFNDCNLNDLKHAHLIYQVTVLLVKLKRQILWIILLVRDCSMFN